MKLRFHPLQAMLLCLPLWCVGCEAKQSIADFVEAKVPSTEIDCSGVSAALKDLEESWDESSMTQVVERFGDCPAAQVYDDIMSAAGQSTSSPRPNSEDLRKAITAGFVVELAKRGYGLFEEDGAMQRMVIADYQRTIGDEVTGVLTFEQATKITDLMSGEASKLASANIWLNAGSLAFEGSPDEPTVFYQAGYLSFEGAWWIEGDDKIATPLNVSKYRCDLRTKECSEVELYMMTMSSDQLIVDTSLNWHRVTEVDHPIYKIQPAGFPGCRSPEISVNVDRKEVFQITTQRSDCELVEDLTAPRVARLRSAAWQSKEIREQAELIETEGKSPQLRALLEGVEADFKPSVRAE